MASNHTTRYGFNQWEGSDQVLRSDFNEDNAKIEAALIELRNTVLSAEITTLLIDNVKKKLEALETRVKALESK